jgi:hypothetical protein
VVCDYCGLELLSLEANEKREKYKFHEGFVLTKWVGHRFTIYGSDGIRAGSKDLDTTYMVNTHI